MKLGKQTLVCVYMFNSWVLGGG